MRVLLGADATPPPPCRTPGRSYSPIAAPSAGFKCVAGVLQLHHSLSQKNPRVRKIRVRNSGAGNGVRQFYGHLEKMRSFCRKTHVHKIPLFWGGVLGGGGECRFYFYGRADFSD